LNVPVLLERQTELLRLQGLLDDAVAGRGRLVFVGGQAGVGKSSLLAELVAGAAGRVTIRRGTADSLTTPAALGPWLEAVPELGAIGELGAVGAAAAPTRPAMYARLRDLLGAAPTLVVLEDVHWADEASLETLRMLGRRVEALPVLVVATYRSEEAGRQQPLAIVLGQLATSSGVERMGLEPLSADGVRRLVEAAGAGIDPAELHRTTGGNPFYVTEVLAAGGSALPAAVRDAVAARNAQLSDAARRVLAAAAVLGPRADVELLTTVSHQPISAVDECVKHGVLVPDGPGWAFRHEIARVAVEQSLLPGELVTLHTAALTALQETGVVDDRRLAHHAAASGQHALAAEHAVRAADQAARLGAHRQAAEQYRLALRMAGRGAEERRRLYTQLSYECYVTDELAEALAAQQQAMELAELAGDAAAVGACERWLSRLSWFSGRGADSLRYGRRAVATLEPVGDGHELGMAYSNLAQLAMLAYDRPGAVHWAERAVALARRTGDLEVEIHALNNVGTARTIEDDSLEGRTLLGRSLELALANDAHEHAARAYTNLGSTALTNGRLADAERDLRRGIAYCTERDLDSWDHYMSSLLAKAVAELGRYDEASRLATVVLQHPRLSPVSEIPATAVLAQLATRRGADPSDLLDRAAELANRTGETQRTVTVALARAEHAWVSGRPQDAAACVAAVWAAATEHPQPHELGELAWWSAVGGTPRTPPTPVSRPFALVLAGRWRDAAAAWREVGSPYWEAVALGRSPDLDDARQAIAVLERIGAPAVRDALLRDRHTAGLPVPRGPRAASRGNPARLTDRELEVLVLLAEGLSNTQIADRLFLSSKTVGHHVSSVLHKIGEPTRARAVASAVRRGIVSPR
jgi:DNA-binding CsgD family transcriptional regulator/tetratricopeptide (TPR) repeat protein